MPHRAALLKKIFWIVVLLRVLLAATLIALAYFNMFSGDFSWGALMFLILNAVAFAALLFNYCILQFLNHVEEVRENFIRWYPFVVMAIFVLQLFGLLRPGLIE